MGTPKYIPNPDKLWELWTQYKDSINTVSVPVTHPKLGVVYLEIPEPIHERGFNCWLNENEAFKGKSIHQYFANQDKLYDDYITTITRIKDDIFKHNYKYSAVGMHKEKLTMALLGLANNIKENSTQEIKVTFENDYPGL